MQHDLRGIRDEMSAMRGYILAMQRDIIYDRLDEHGRRLELTDTPT
jgi:hypothetical protein